jgi:hypothetical protein
MDDIDPLGPSMGSCRFVPTVTIDAAFSVDQLSDTTYSLRQGRDVSLVTKEELLQFLRNQLGGTHDDLGGGPLG